MKADSAAWWLDLPEDRPRFGLQPSLEVMLLGLALIEREGQWLRMQRVFRAAARNQIAGGCFFVGTHQRFVRGAYLLERSSFVIESGTEEGEITRYGIPADLDLTVGVVRRWWHDPWAFRALPWIPRIPGVMDEVWSAAYARLLSVPRIPPVQEPPLTIMQYRNRGLMMSAQQHALLPAIASLRQELDSQIKRREDVPIP